MIDDRGAVGTSNVMVRRTTRSSLDGGGKIDAQNIHGMLSSMTDEDSIISLPLNDVDQPTQQHRQWLHHTTATSTTNNNSGSGVMSPYNITKILAMRMLQGYTPTSHKCHECNSPLMESELGIVQCVVCVGGLSVGEEMRRDVVGDERDDEVEESDEGAAADEDGQLVAEVDRLMAAKLKQRRMKKNLVCVTEEGDIELRRMSTQETWNEEEGSYLGGEVVAYSESVEDAVVANYGLDESNRGEELSLFESDGAGSGSLNEEDDIPAFNCTNYPDLAQEMDRKRVSELEADRDAALIIKSRRKKRNTMKKNGGIKLLEAIDEMSSASSTRKRQQEEEELQLLASQLAAEGGGTTSAGSSIKSEKSIKSGKSLPLPQPKAYSFSVNDASVEDDNNLYTSASTPVMMAVSHHNASIIQDIDSTLVSYNKGKAFATQIIEETNTILDDLVSTEGGGGGGEGGDVSVARKPSSSVSPSMKSDGYGKKVKKKLRRIQADNNDLDAKVKDCVVMYNECTTTPMSSPGPLSLTPLSPMAGQSPRSRKRLTINNISSETTHHADRNKSYMPSWENSMKNSVQNNSSDEGLDNDDAHDVVSQDPPPPPSLVSSPRAVQREETDDFFTEIRRKALLSKAMSTQSKVVAELESTIQTRKDDTLLHVRLNGRDNNGEVEDDVSELESPQPFGAFHSGTNEATKKSLSSPKSKATSLVGQDTIIEIEQRWRAANIRRLEKQQLQDEMSPATAERKTILAVVPDDEKRDASLQTIRQAGVILPFDESIKQKQKASTPKSRNPRPIELVTVEECSSDEAEEERSLDEEVSTPQVFAILPPTTNTITRREYHRPTVISDAQSQISSLASLTPSLQLETKRIAQLEADALCKHKEAELAAKTAREALEQMTLARKARHEKKKEMKSKRKDAPEGNNNAEDSSHRLNPTNGALTNMKLLPHQGDGVKEKAVIGKRNANEDMLSMSSTLSSLDNKVEIKREKKQDVSSDDSDSCNDSNTASSTSSYLDKYQLGLERRRNERHTRNTRRMRRDYDPITPKRANRRIPSRPPKLRFSDSESSASTFSSYSYGNMPERMPRGRPTYHDDHYRRRRSRERNAPATSGRGTAKPNLLLPSLCSPDASPQTSGMPQQTTSGMPSQQHHQRQPSPYDHQQQALLVPPPPHSMVNAPFQPNHDMYMPGVGFERVPMDPAAGMIRPPPLGRIASEPVPQLYQQPLMAQQYQQYSTDGQIGRLPPQQRRQPSFESRMATLKLAGLPPNHPYGQSRMSNRPHSSMISTGAYHNPMMTNPPQQKVEFGTGYPRPQYQQYASHPGYQYESRNDLSSVR